MNCHCKEKGTIKGFGVTGEENENVFEGEYGWTIIVERVEEEKDHIYMGVSYSGDLYRGPWLTIEETKRLIDHLKKLVDSPVMHLQQYISKKGTGNLLKDNKGNPVLLTETQWDVIFEKSEEILDSPFFEKIGEINEETDIYGEEGDPNY